jgi:hypothetical protein
VDEEYQGIGIGSFLFGLMARLAKERGLRSFTADVLFSNTAMMKVFKKGGFPIKSGLDDGVCHLEISLEGKVSGANLAPKPEGRVHVPLKGNMPTGKALLRIKQS